MSFPLFQDVRHFRTGYTGSSSDTGTLEVGKAQKSWTLCFLPPSLSHFLHRNPIRSFYQAQDSSGSNLSGFFLTSARQLGCAIFLGKVFPALSSDQVGLICLPCSRRIFHPTFSYRIVFPCQFKKSSDTFFRKAQAGTTIPVSVHPFAPGRVDTIVMAALERQHHSASSVLALSTSIWCIFEPPSPPGPTCHSNVRRLENQQPCRTHRGTGPGRKSDLVSSKQSQPLIISFRPALVMMGGEGSSSLAPPWEGSVRGVNLAFLALYAGPLCTICHPRGLAPVCPCCEIPLLSVGG